MRHYCLTETHFRSVMNEAVLGSDFVCLLVNRQAPSFINGFFTGSNAAYFTLKKGTVTRPHFCISLVLRQSLRHRKPRRLHRGRGHTFQPTRTYTSQPAHG